MNYSSTYIAVFVMVLSSLLPKIGVNLGNADLTTTVSVLLTIGGALWALIQRYKAGGIHWSGIRQ